MPDLLPKTLAVFGWFADHSSSRRVPLLVSLLTLAGATILFCLGKSVYVVFASRLLQGLSSAAVYAVGLALLVDTVGLEEVGKWMGFALSSSSIGLVVSPVLGGLVYFQAGYYAVFGMIISLISFDILLRLASIEKKTAAKWLGPCKVNTHNYGTEGHAAVPSNRTGNDRSSPSANDGNFAEEVSDQALGKSIVNHKGSRDREFRMPTTIILLKSPRLLTAIYGVFVQVAILASFDTILPLFVKQPFGWNSFQAGMVFLTVAIPALAGPLAGRLSDRYGPRWIAISGFLLAAPTLVLLRFVNKHDTTHVLLLCGLLLLIGQYCRISSSFCFVISRFSLSVSQYIAYFDFLPPGATLTLIISPLAAELSFVVQEMERQNSSIFGRSGAYGQAFALFNCAMASATIFGPLLAGFIATKFGWNVVTWTLAIFCASGAVPVVGFPKFSNLTPWI